MASLRSLPGTKNFIACFTDAGGRRRQRSTGTHIRKDALKVLHQLARHPLTDSGLESFLADWNKAQQP